jgi:hypothetical protein
MTKTFAVLTAILAASFSVPTKAEANPAWVGAVLMGAGLGGVILSFRQATRHGKQQRVRDRPRLAAGAASGAFLAAPGGSPSSSPRED